MDQKSIKSQFKIRGTEDLRLLKSLTFLFLLELLNLDFLFWFELPQYDQTSACDNQMLQTFTCISKAARSLPGKVWISEEFQRKAQVLFRQILLADGQLLDARSHVFAGKERQLIAIVLEMQLTDIVALANDVITVPKPFRYSRWPTKWPTSEC